MKSSRLQVYGILILLFSVLFAVKTLQAQADPFDPVIKALKAGDAHSLAVCFNSTIDLGLPEKDNTYSKSQAEMVIKDFFRDHPPTSFSIEQKGETDATSHFAIGTYKCNKDAYQVYILMKNDDDKFLVHKIKFELKK